MGIQVQPCCCDRWIVISRNGYMYDINLSSGKLSNPRYMGVAVDASVLPANSNRSLVCIGKHPKTKKLYSHQQAYDNNQVSNLYELSTDGTITLIGPLRGPSDIPPDLTYDSGIAASGNAFTTDGTLYSVAWNGFASRNQKLATISLATGAATPFPTNIDNIVESVAGVGSVTSNIYAMDYHTQSGIMFAFGSLSTGPPPSGGPRFQMDWYLGEINLVTGQWINRRPTITGVADFLADMKFLSNTQIVGVTANANPRIAYIRNLTTGSLDIGPNITGMVPGDTAIQGIAKVD